MPGHLPYEGHCLSIPLRLPPRRARDAASLMKLIKKDILPCRQVAPYAPLALNKTDLDTDPVRSILDHLKETGVLVLEGVSLARQESLFQ